MIPIEKFEDLEVWKEARDLSKLVYSLTSKEPFSNDLNLERQVKKSSGLIMDNIAEGFERNDTQDFIQFLSMAKASCGEVRSQLYRAFDQNYISNDEFFMLNDKATEISNMLDGFMNYLKISEIEEVTYKS